VRQRMRLHRQHRGAARRPHGARRRTCCRTRDRSVGAGLAGHGRGGRCCSHWAVFGSSEPCTRTNPIWLVAIGNRPRRRQSLEQPLACPADGGTAPRAQTRTTFAAPTSARQYARNARCYARIGDGACSGQRRAAPKRRPEPPLGGVPAQRARGCHLRTRVRRRESARRAWPRRRRAPSAPCRSWCRR
jgi:hypothetical protein